MDDAATPPRGGPLAALEAERDRAPSGLEIAVQRAELVGCLVLRELRNRYRRSLLGFLWTMLIPLLGLAVVSTVFGRALGAGVENYAVYALSGILFWNFFHQSALGSMQTLRANAEILQKMPVPRAAFPVATVLAGAVNWGLALLPLLAIAVATGQPLGASLLFLPVAVAIAVGFTLGIGLLLSPLAVFFTDVVEITGVFLTLVLYLTPVFYPPSIVPERFRWLVEWNPVAVVLELFRRPIVEGTVPELAHVAAAATVAALALAVGTAAFRRASDHIPFHV